MRRLSASLAVVVLLLVGFYVAWPLWSLHRIAEAIRAQDEAVLAAKIDFPSVRASLRPLLSEEVTKRYEQLQSGSSNLRALLATQIKADVLPRLVDIALDTIVTPANVLRIARNRQALKEALQRALEEQIVLGGLGKRNKQAKDQPAAVPVPPAVRPEPRQERPWLRYSYANIKSASLTGPLQFEIGVNRNPDAPDAELMTRMAFTGYDWKVIGLTPRF